MFSVIQGCISQKHRKPKVIEAPLMLLGNAAQVITECVELILKHLGIQMEKYAQIFFAIYRVGD